MAIAGELPEGGTQKATFRKGAEGPAHQRGSAGGDQGGVAGDGGETGEVGGGEQIAEAIATLVQTHARACRISTDRQCPPRLGHARCNEP